MSKKDQTTYTLSNDGVDEYKILKTVDTCSTVVCRFKSTSQAEISAVLWMLQRANESRRP